MRKPITLLFALLFGLILPALPALAHHAFATEFDLKKPVTFKGFVTKIAWTNPHAWFYVNVKDEKTGQIENWGFELGSPAALWGLGWSPTSMKIGEEVVVEGSLARDGSKKVNARNVTIVATGKKFGAASSGENQQQP